MIGRRTLLGAAGGLATVAVAAVGLNALGVNVSQPVSQAVVGQAVAGEKAAFSHAAFAQAQAEGRPILVEISASWCTVCARQKPIIASLAAEPRFSDLIVFEVDFDSQKDIVREFDAFRQATLIAYKGSTEVARSVYESRSSEIENMLEQTL